MVMTVTWLHRPFSLRERLALAVEILVIYVKAWYWLRRDGVRPTVDRLRATDSPAPPADSLITYTAVSRLGGVVMRTLAPLPSDTRCLARSLVLTGVLARRGLSSTLVIGVSPAPEFKAHAWVEHWERPALPPGDGEYERLLEL
jgi:Transglutaminase-like superfamily